MSWLFFALLTAAFAAARDIFVKCNAKGINPSLVALTQHGGAFPLIGIYALLQGLPEFGPYFLPALVASGMLLALGTVLYFKAIELSDLSLMVPLRAITPALILLISPLLIGEKVSLLGAAGVCAIVAGLFVVGLTSKKTTIVENYTNAPGTKYMIAAVIVFAFCALTEKVGIEQSAGPIFVALENLIAAYLLAVFFAKRSTLPLKEVRSHVRILIPVGILFAFLMTLQSYAFEIGPISYIIAIKRTSVVPTVLFGCIVLGEGSLVQRTLGAVIVVSGAILIGFAS